MTTMNITINGEPHSFTSALNVREMVEKLGLNPAKIAIERNLEIVPRSTYEMVKVAEGDAYEIVHFIGGGDSATDQI